jgi:hypothetical protein
MRNVSLTLPLPGNAVPLDSLSANSTKAELRLSLIEALICNPLMDRDALALAKDLRFCCEENQ